VVEHQCEDGVCAMYIVFQRVFMSLSSGVDGSLEMNLSSHSLLPKKTYLHSLRSCDRAS
jgi:hypothetical protein